MNARDEGYELWKKGVKYQEIAEKCGVSLSTVKSWASRHWKKQSEKDTATNKKKKLQPTTKKVATEKKDAASTKRKKGPPEGNQNAKGNSGGGAPKRNQNNLKHGAYAKIYWDTLDETEQELLQDIPEDEEYQYEQQLALYTIRERRIMNRIKDMQEAGEKSKGLFLKSITKEKTFEYSGKVNSGMNEKTIANITDTTQTETESIMNMIMILEEELTKVQKAKTKCIDSLAKIRLEKKKLNKANAGNSAVDDWIAAILGEDVMDNK